MNLREKLKELEHETSAIKGILYEALISIDRVLTKIEDITPKQCCKRYRCSKRNSLKRDVRACTATSVSKKWCYTI